MSEKRPPIVLGVDGGGTKTVAILSDREGTVLGYGRAGSCDIYSNDGAADEVETAVERACVMAGIDRHRIGPGVFSLAGADWPEDFTYWQGQVKDRHLASEAVVLNDAVGALNADLPEGNAVVVVCGTGAAIGSRNGRGDIWHSSFWQLTQGGAELSDKTLNAVYRAALGITPPTRLTDPVLRHHGAASVEDLLHLFTSRQRRAPKGKADLVPILCDAAEAGDPAAHDILAQHGASLADFAFAAATKVGMSTERFHLLLKGGVFRNASDILRRSLLERMRWHGLNFTVFDGTSEPIKGAVLAALRIAGTDVSDTVSKRLDATFPEREFFHTAH